MPDAIPFVTFKTEDVHAWPGIHVVLAADLVLNSRKPPVIERMNRQMQRDRVTPMIERRPMLSDDRLAIKAAPISRGAISERYLAMRSGDSSLVPIRAENITPASISGAKSSGDVWDIQLR